MKENTIKAILVLALTGAVTYFQIMLVPVLVLAAVMLGDYITGIMSAWMTKTLSSKAGITGIVKKISYLGVVAVGVTVDFVLQSALSTLGVEFGTKTYAFGLLVTLWLIINELISILENLGEIGAPLPGFLVKLLKRLEKTVEDKGDERHESDENDKVEESDKDKTEK